MDRLPFAPMLLGIVLLAGCASAALPPTASPPASPTPKSLPETAAAAQSQPGLAEGTVRLQRTACFGRCPQYTVEIDASGAVRFDGERNVMQPGVQTGRADAAALAQLRGLLADPRVRRLKDVYRPGESGCGQLATDQPGAIIDWQLDGERHHLQHYQGCAGAPRVLDDLAEAIDRAAGSAGWVRSGALR